VFIPADALFWRISISGQIDISGYTENTVTNSSVIRKARPGPVPPAPWTAIDVSGYTEIMVAEDLAGRMRSAAVALIGALDDGQRELAARSFGDTASRRWLEYRPEYRPGACLADFPNTARKAAFRLLATGLSGPAYAQAMGIIALEETLDRLEGWVRGRHSGDYWVSVYGDPAGSSGGGPWGWRFEGHHLSVSMTVAGGRVSPAPVFLGANPHRISHAGHAVSRPLAPEEDLARALLDALGPAGRSAAVVSGSAPSDIVSGPRGDIPAVEPCGVAAADAGPAARAALDGLLALYLGRLPDELAAAEYDRVSAQGDLRFAWAGPTTPGAGHYYRLQADDLLIEYDNTQNGANHAHTVLRRPRSDFGADILAAHYAAAPHSR